MTFQTVSGQHKVRKCLYCQYSPGQDRVLLLKFRGFVGLGSQSALQLIGGDYGQGSVQASEVWTIQRGQKTSPNCCHKAGKHPIDYIIGVCWRFAKTLKNASKTKMKYWESTLFWPYTLSYKLKLNFNFYGFMKGLIRLIPIHFYTANL